MDDRSFIGDIIHVTIKSDGTICGDITGTLLNIEEVNTEEGKKEYYTIGISKNISIKLCADEVAAAEKVHTFEEYKTAIEIMIRKYNLSPENPDDIVDLCACIYSRWYRIDEEDKRTIARFLISVNYFVELFNELYDCHKELEWVKRQKLQLELDAIKKKPTLIQRLFKRKDKKK